MSLLDNGTWHGTLYRHGWVESSGGDEAVAPFGGVGASGTGARFGGPAANVEAFTETQWLTVRGDIARYPF
ncbi:hypothetical protein [Micromonospora radicis]|uniref:hypothetical protein n=1 Tax=Micromonospora radicis TaxID=1894971 RepID=UPI0018F3015D|nr:hypothetical protein [Micromonospora radicis]